MGRTVFLFHGTEGHPSIHWLGWLSEKLQANGHQVIAPQFPSPPVVPANIQEWRSILAEYAHKIDENTVFIGHSLGGLFALRVLETLAIKVYAVVIVASAVGVKPIDNFERESAFCGYDFNWGRISSNSKHFVTFYSDDDPYISIGNGELASKKLNSELVVVSKAGHFNTDAGYTTFGLLWQAINPLLSRTDED